jgi:hypothetical protein
MKKFSLIERQSSIAAPTFVFLRLDSANVKLFPLRKFASATKFSMRMA